MQSSSCGQLNIVESDFIASIHVFITSVQFYRNVAAKSVMVLENERIQQLKLAAGWHVSYSYISLFKLQVG